MCILYFFLLVAASHSLFRLATCSHRPIRSLLSTDLSHALKNVAISSNIEAIDNDRLKQKVAKLDQELSIWQARANGAEVALAGERNFILGASRSLRSIITYLITLLHLCSLVLSNKHCGNIAELAELAGAVTTKDGKHTGTFLYMTRPCEIVPSAL